MDPLPQYNAHAFLPYIPTTASPPFPPLKITHTSTWTYSGPLLTDSNLPTSFHIWSKATVTSPAGLLQRLVPLLTYLYGFFEKAGVQHYWLTLRATTPTSEYNVPRWHVDDDFFAPVSARLDVDDVPDEMNANAVGKKKEKRKKEKREEKFRATMKNARPRAGWKLCTTLLGPSTLFIHPSSNFSALLKLKEAKKTERARRAHICSSIRCAGCFDTGEAVRTSLSAAFADEEVVQARYGEVAIFRIGEEEGAVHSEPRCDVDRVFVNVVPGSEEELRNLMKRFGMEFPRAWSLGVPVTGVDLDEKTDLQMDESKNLA